jgi:hypothetical protein
MSDESISSSFDQHSSRGLVDPSGDRGLSVTTKERTGKPDARAIDIIAALPKYCEQTTPPSSTGKTSRMRQEQPRGLYREGRYHHNGSIPETSESSSS